MVKITLKSLLILIVLYFFSSTNINFGLTLKNKLKFEIIRPIMIFEREKFSFHDAFEFIEAKCEFKFSLDFAVRKKSLTYLPILLNRGNRTSFRSLREVFVKPYTALT